ncbi:hypothetical protein Tco_0040756 [Tanacetum coccineum]
MDFNYGADSQTIDFKMDVEWRNLQRLINRGLEIEGIGKVQTMSMGCGMVPMMFPGDQQYVLPMGMGTGMGMNTPIVPNHDILAGSSIPNPVASAAIVAA